MSQLYPGQRIHRWTILSEGEPARSKRGRARPRWYCQCECGIEKLVLDQSLRLALRSEAGGSRSCGCLATERATKHAHNTSQRPTSEYMAWLAAKKRCFNPSSRSYRHYGRRGITMCVEWARSFRAFLRDMGPKPDPTYSLDRIDPNGNYEAGNCRWAAPEVQARNKRNVRWYQLNGERLILAEVAARLGLTRDQARSLEKRGALPAQRLPARLRPDAALLRRPYTIDLNDVLPLGWPLAEGSGMAAGD